MKVCRDSCICFLVVERKCGETEIIRKVTTSVITACVYSA